MDMELNRFDYAVLKLLKQKKCTSFFKGMTKNEMIEAIGSSDATTHRKLLRLKKEGYLENGCKSGNAHTYIITDKGLKILAEGEKENA